MARDRVHIYSTCFLCKSRTVGNYCIHFQNPCYVNCSCTASLHKLAAGRTGLPLVREKSGKFKVREKSGNFGILKKVREI